MILIIAVYRPTIISQHHIRVLDMTLIITVYRTTKISQHHIRLLDMTLMTAVNRRTLYLAIRHDPNDPVWPIMA